MLPLIGIAVESRYVAQRQPAGLAAALERAGCAPLMIDPEISAGAGLDTLDLLMARGRSAKLLDLLAGAEAAHVRTINRRSAIGSVLDKASMARALAKAGLPTPATRAGPFAMLAAELRPREFPVVVKPVFGDNARGVHLVHSRDELDDLPWTEPRAIVQEFIPSDGFDLKLYAIGTEVRAVRKPSPISDSVFAEPQLVSTTPELRALALRCGILFGLELFGVDCIVTGKGPVVIEVNDFPNYSGLHDADDALARYALDRARSALTRRLG